MADDPAATSLTADDPVAVARAALARHEWQAALAGFMAADRDGALDGEALEGFAQAAYFSAEADLERELMERAFKAHLDAGASERAAAVALYLSQVNLFGGQPSMASAWLRRAERLLGPDGDSYAHGYLAVTRSELAARRGDTEAALSFAERAIDIGERAADADLRATALASLGAIKIATGSPEDGFALMEEASIAGVNGELSPFTAGITLCRMISACRDVSDYRRASEWIEATERYCERQSLTGFPGVCRIHKAELEAVGGAWARAEADLELATDELRRFHAAPPQADGFYAIGDIRRLRGEYDAAEAALREAHARGRSPQPALALIRLAQGNVKAATTAIESALADAVGDNLTRVRLLPARVDIALAAGDVGRARESVDELAGLGALTSPALSATRRATLGRVLVAEGDPEGGARELRAAVREWRDVGAPYEVARTRAALGAALRASGDDEDADLELRAAIDGFRTLGAAPDIEAAERERRAAEAGRGTPVQVRRTFMFTDIVGSTRLAEALGDDAWERLLRWHDETLRREVAAGGGEIVNTTGDGFFVAFDTAAQGLDCAISIQRALRDHRTSTGFALSVRIGLHNAEANRRGSDYSGKGVHVAARVAALADAGEILVTADVLAGAPDRSFATSPAREVEVRGVSGSVDVTTVDWS
jgi:class 3 adenylate cyclase